MDKVMQNILKWLFRVLMIKEFLKLKQFGNKFQK